MEPGFPGWTTKSAMSFRDLIAESRKIFTGLLYNLFIQVFPLRIAFFNKVYLPLPLILLKPFFSFNGVFGIIKYFIVNQSAYSIFTGKALYCLLFMFPYSFYEVRCYAYIQSSVFTACQDIYVILSMVCLPIVLHVNCIKKLWIPRSSRGMTKKQRGLHGIKK